MTRTQVAVKMTGTLGGPYYPRMPRAQSRRSCCHRRRLWGGPALAFAVPPFAPRRVRRFWGLFMLFML